MPDRDYSHRDVTDKLGIKPGSIVAFDEQAAPLDEALRRKVLERTGRDPAGPEEPADVVLATLHAGMDAAMLLRTWRSHIKPSGGIWLLTPKRGQPGYLDQRELIQAGGEAGLVDNKSCSVDETTSGMHFVIRRSDRG
ncbi:MAG TPA: DUF3052 family protein [Chloroflexia bacterium]|jgi:hypothetical protein